MLKTIIIIIIILIMVMMHFLQKTKLEMFSLNNTPIVINAVGDVSFTRDIGKFIHLKRRKDYNYPLSFVKNILEKSDLTLINLETTITPRLNYLSPLFRKNKLNFSSHYMALNSLVNNGVNVVNLANNHMNDYGSIGLENTIDLVNKAGLTHVGTHKDISNIFVINGVRIGILGVCRNFLKVKNSHINSYNSSRYQNLLEQVRLLKTKSDIVIVTIHWGTEYKLKPNRNQRFLAKLLVENGSDVIIGHHPHVIQSMETIKVGNRKGTVFYSIGNFLFDSHKKKKGVRNSLILQIQLYKTFDGKISLQFNYLPCIIHPELGFIPIPQKKKFSKVFPKKTTKKGNDLEKYLKCSKYLNSDSENNNYLLY